jgi:uncharacterized protein YggE
MTRLLFATLLILLPFAAGAEPVITVTGQGEVTAAPDIATVSVGVEVSAPRADAALAQNAARMAEIFAAIEALGIDRKDVQTSQISLNPQWDSQTKSYDEPLRITGFLATNIVTVRLRDIPRLGAVLDSLTATGANRIQGIGFGVVDPRPLIDQARGLAVRDAVRKAALYAEAAGLRLGPILSIDDGAGTAPPPAYRMEAMMEATPVAEGEVSYSAAVTIRFRLESGAP